jgi:hypothetical protein
MDTLIFRPDHSLDRSISFTEDEGFRVQLSTTLGWTEVYPLGRERAAELWAWLGDMLVAPESRDGGPAVALPT